MPSHIPSTSKIFLNHYEFSDSKLTDPTKGLSSVDIPKASHQYEVSGTVVRTSHGPYFKQDLALSPPGCTRLCHSLTSRPSLRRHRGRLPSKDSFLWGKRIHLLNLPLIFLLFLKVDVSQPKVFFFPL